MVIYWPNPYLKLLSIKTKDQKEPNNITDSREQPGVDIIKTTLSIIHTENCLNIPEHITAITKGEATLVPIILSRFTTQISSTIFIQLPKIVTNLINVENKVENIKCIFLQCSNTLFVKGFIHKKLTFATINSFNSNSLYSNRNLQHYTIDIPFSCNTSVIYNGNNPLPLVENSSFYYNCRNGYQNSKENYPYFTEESEINCISTEYFNERPYCEIEYSKIIESNQIVERSPWKNSLPFTKLEENMLILLTFSLLQNQLITIPPSCTYAPGHLLLPKRGNSSPP